MFIPTVLYSAVTWGLRERERDVFEMRCLTVMDGVTRMNRIRNEEMQDEQE